MALEIISGMYRSVNEFWYCGLSFGEDADNPYEIYEEIIKKPISY